MVPVLLPAAAAAPLRRCTASLALYRPEDYTATAPATARPHRHNITRKVCISGGRTGTGHGTNNSRWRAGTQRRYCLGTRGLVSDVLRAWTLRCVSNTVIRAVPSPVLLWCAHCTGDGGWCWCCGQWSLLEVCWPALRAAAGGRVSPGRVAGAAPRATGCTSTRLGGCGASCTPGRVLPGHGRVQLYRLYSLG